MSMADEFKDAIEELCEEAGVKGIIMLPGVWEIVSEEFNNAAFQVVQENRSTSGPPCDTIAYWRAVVEAMRKYRDSNEEVCPWCGGSGSIQQHPEYTEKDIRWYACPIC